MLKKLYFCDFRGGPDPCPPSGSAHALHSPMSKSRANALLIFQCPGICLTPSQVGILVSDDSLAFCPTMYNIVFTWVETIKSEVGTVKHVEALQFFFFTGADFVDRHFKCLKPGLYPVLCVCVCVSVWGGGGGSRRYNHSNIYHDPAIVSRVSTARGVGGWGRGYKCILLSQRVLVYACAK